MQTDELTAAPESVDKSSVTEPSVSQGPVVSKKTTIWLLAGLVIFLLGTTSLFAYKYYTLMQQLKDKQPASSVTPTKVVEVSPSPIPSPEPTVDLTIEWQTYNDQTYGYSIKYPQDWDVEETNYTGYLSTIRVFQKSNSLNEVNFSIWPDVSRSCSELSSLNITGKSFRLAGLEAVMYNLPGGHNPPQDIICFEKNDRRYEFQLFPGKLSSSPDDTETNEMLLQIISTFKFTN